MKILCITDPKTHPEFDTTVELYNELANDRRFELFHTSLASAQESEAFHCRPIRSAIPYDEFLRLDEYLPVEMRWNDFSLAFDRADHPLPDLFHERLALHESKTVFINSPEGLRRTKQKAFAFEIARDVLKDAVFTRNALEIRNFLKLFPEVVAKMNTSYGGKGVFRIFRKGDQFEVDNVSTGTLLLKSLDEVIEWLLARDRDPFQLCRYLKNVTAGDKRILVVGSEIYGGYLRKSPSGSWIQNVTSGGQAFPATVTEGERLIIERTAPAFQELGVFTLGYDFLLDDDGETWLLSEINAGNIGGYGRLQLTSGLPVYGRLLEWLLERAQMGSVKQPQLTMSRKQ